MSQTPSSTFSQFGQKVSAFLDADLERTGQRYLDLSSHQKALLTTGTVGMAFLGVVAFPSSFLIAPQLSTALLTMSETFLIVAASAVHSRAYNISLRKLGPRSCPWSSHPCN